MVERRRCILFSSWTSFRAKKRPFFRGRMAFAKVLVLPSTVLSKEEEKIGEAGF